jgi:hypothetical protein
VSKKAFEAGPMKSFMIVTAFLDRMMREGHLRQDNPWVAMVHLISLNEAGLMNRRMLGIVRDITDEMIREADAEVGRGLLPGVRSRKARSRLTRRDEIG